MASSRSATGIPEHLSQRADSPPAQPVCHIGTPSLTHRSPPANEAGDVYGHDRVRMRTLGKSQGKAIAGIALAMALDFGCSAAQARKSDQATPPQALANTDAVWRDCKHADPAMAPAIDAARHLLARSWLASRGSYFAAYTMPGEKRSPFDLSPREPNTGPREGLVEARHPRCTFSASEADERPYRVRFIAPFYRFYEDGQGWSPPLRSGLMMEANVARAGNEWKADALPSERTILLPDQHPRSAEMGKLPPDAAWAEPIPGCKKRLRWNGHDCVSRRR